MESIKMAALVPHGNIAAELESERKSFFSLGLLPFYPFACPLRFFKELGKSNYNDSITPLSDFFQSHSLIAGKPLALGNFVYRPLHIIPAQKNADIPEVFYAGPFELRTFSFLYGVLPQGVSGRESSFLQPDTFLPLFKTGAEIPLNVFKIAVFSLFFNSTSVPDVFRCEWTEDAERWIKNRKKKAPQKLCNRAVKI